MVLWLRMLSWILQLQRVDDGIIMLRGQALDITNLVSFVSLNMAAIRKILKKVSKNIHSEGPRGPGGSAAPGIFNVEQGFQLREGVISI